MKENKSDYYEDKTKGCIFGSLVGDCLGVTSEFMTSEQIKKFEKTNPSWPYTYFGSSKSGYFALGESTDDGELTLCLLESIYDEEDFCRTIFHPDIFMNKMIEWKEKNGKGIGYTVRKAIRLMKSAKEWHTVGRTLWLADKNNASNGSLMRLSPVPAIYYDTGCILFGVTILSSVLTHYHIETLLSCLAFSYFCDKFIEGKGSVDYLKIYEEMLNYDVIVSNIKKLIKCIKHPEEYLYLDDYPPKGFDTYDADSFLLKTERTKAIEILNMIFEDYLSEKGKKIFDDAYTFIHSRIRDLEYFNPNKIPRDQIGYVVHTLIVGLWAEINSSSFEEGIQKVVRIGLDADTYGAVAGAILGSKYGFSSIPERYIEPLWLKEKVNKLLGELL